MRSLLALAVVGAAWPSALVVDGTKLPTPGTTATGSFQRIAHSSGIDTLVSPSCLQPRDVLGVLRRRGPLEGGLAQRVVEHVGVDDFAWTTDRHKLFPTTDCEVHSLPWLEAEMAAELRGRLLPAIATLFEVDEAALFVRDQFVVKYSSAMGQQRGLSSHYDESCFSFVMQLNDPADFAGGGTLFAHAPEVIRVAQGETLLFCGYNYHTGVEVTSGTRYILTGFVDYRADADSVRPFYGSLPGELPRPYGAGSHDFPSPHLTTNAERLSEAYGGLRGDALMHAIAYSPAALAHVDLTKLRAMCAGWLEHGRVPNERFYQFLQMAIGLEGGDGEDEVREGGADADGGRSLDAATGRRRAGSTAT